MSESSTVVPILYAGCQVRRGVYQIGDLGLAHIARMTQEELADVPSQVICELQDNLLECTLGDAYEQGLVPDEEVPFLLAIGSFLEEEYTRYEL